VTCGAGTKQVQDSSGNAKCVPIDGITEPCVDDADAGTVIIGGKCVSAIICGPNTVAVKKMDGSGQYYCQGIGTGMVNKCDNAMLTASQICISGTIRDFASGMPISSSKTVHLEVYDPLDFLMNGSASTALAKGDFTGPTYSFDGFNLPGDGLIALAVTDGVGTTPIGATGLQGVTGQKYTLDGYSVAAATTTAWTAIDPTFDSKGAYVGIFYSDASRALTNNDFTQYEKNPLTGITMISDAGGTPAALTGVKYLGPTFDVIDGALTTTGAIGAAVAPFKGLGTFAGCTGAGCPATSTMKWEVHPGGSAPHAVFVDRFHPMP
jgi:hypothetical protein